MSSDWEAGLDEGEILCMIIDATGPPGPGNREMPVLVVSRVDVYAFRQPLLTPVATSFGTMRDRPAVFVRLEDEDGAFGWGEVFANWPASGAEHRCRLIAEDLSDLILGRTFANPREMFEDLTNRSRIRALQCGEPGPFAQCIAGLDIAAWDLSARKAGMPLMRHISKDAEASVAVYASGIHIDAAQEQVKRAAEWGFEAFKVKVGFDAVSEPEKLARLRSGDAAGKTLMADANQAWDEVVAARFLGDVAHLELAWLEEPVPAASPPDIWRRLSEISATPLAGGENIAGFEAFSAAISDGHLSVLQPDVAKWGGITGCHEVAARARVAGRTYCPHFLGGGIGLSGSAHLLAAVGGEGRLEVDVNTNILRDAFDPVSTKLKNGRWHLRDAPGLGFEILPEQILPYQTTHISISRKGLE